MTAQRLSLTKRPMSNLTEGISEPLADQSGRVEPELEKWCAFCIIEARKRGLRGFSVTLSNVEDCESHLHQGLQLVKAWAHAWGRKARNSVNDQFSPRKLRGNYQVIVGES